VIIYLDTSALVKLYCREEGTDEVKAAVERAKTVSTSLLTFVETKSAFVRKHRDGGISSTVYQEISKQFQMDWREFVVIGVTDEIVLSAGALVESDQLRAADAIHLASAKKTQQVSGVETVFYVADRALERAAKAEGLAAALIGV